MPNYENGKIYSIRSPHTEEVYIGSTTQSLAKRFSEHKKTPTSSIKLFDTGDAYIELIEEYPCQNREQLNRREGEIIRQTQNCINKCIAGRTRKEYFNDNYELLRSKRIKYNEVNKTILEMKRKEYYETNQEKILLKKKIYDEENKELLKQKQKQYRETNEYEINRKKREKRQLKKESDLNTI